MLVLGAVDAPPGGHAEDVDEAGDAVEDVVPATDLRDALGGDPRDGVGAAGGEEVRGALEVRDDGDQDVDRDDHEREGAEPLGLAEGAPLVLDDHEADAAGEGGVDLGVVEPAVLVDVRGVVDGPVLALRHADGDGDAVDGHRDRSGAEDDEAADLGAAGELVEQDEADEDQHPAQELEWEVDAVVKQHFGFLPFGAYRLAMNSRVAA